MGCLLCVWSAKNMMWMASVLPKSRYTKASGLTAFKKTSGQLVTKQFSKQGNEGQGI